ncbi:MAG: YDG domain-containing protein, partial [Deltaproteobacteria bacterium]|nr:YDG domain-containing protein [Deltaproteobacteria bacterium]
LTNPIYSIPDAGSSELLFNTDNAYNSAVNAGSYTPKLYSTQQGYDIGYVNGLLTINPAEISTTTIDLSGSRVYDGTIDVLAGIFTLGGLIDGQTLTLTGVGTVADKNVGLNKPVTLGTLALVDGGYGDLAGNYTLDGGTHKATITAFPLTVTAVKNTKAYDGNTSAAASPTITAGSLAVGDTATLSEVYDSKLAGTGKTLTPAAVIADGNGGNNYLVTYVNNTTGVIEDGQTISGMLDVAAAEKTIYFAVNGTLLADSASTDDGGNYSLMFPLNSIPDNSALLAYVANDISVKSASVYIATGGDITNLSLTSNTVTAAGGTMSNATFGIAKGALSSADIPYSVLSTDLTLSPSFNFMTASGTTYSIDGNTNITTTGTGNIIFGGPVTGTGYNLSATAGGNITLNGLINTGTGNVTLNSGGAIINGMGSATSISAAALFAEAVNGIGSGDPLVTGVSQITALNTTANNIEIDNTGILAVSGLINLGTGDVLLENTGAITTDTSTVTSSGGIVSIIARSPLTIGAGGVSAADSISLAASPSGGLDNLTINGPIASANGSIILSAGSGLILGPGGSLSAPNGTITLNGGPAVSNNAAVIGNQTATDNTVSSLITAMGTIESTAKDEDDNELEKKTTEGGEQTTDDKRTDDDVTKYCN